MGFKITQANKRSVSEAMIDLNVKQDESVPECPEKK
jgi:hypothetical protein